MAKKAKSQKRLSKKAEAEYATKTHLKKMFWTDALITKYLGDPDREVRNPSYRSGPPMQLYNLARVQDVASRPEVAEALKNVEVKRAVRSGASKAAAERKRAQLLEAIASVSINLQRYDPDEVRAAAIRHYNALWSARGKFDKYADADSDPEFLLRITRNFIRHELVDYDSIVAALRNQIGRNEAYELLRKRVESEVDTVYPEFAISAKSVGSNFSTLAIDTH